MSKSVFDTIFNIQAICIFSSFLISLRLVKNNNIPRYLTGFFWYPTIAFLTIIPAFFTLNYSLGLFSLSKILNNISIVFHFVLLSIFILRAMPGEVNKKFIVTLIIVFLILILYFLAISDLTKRNTFIFGVTNFGLILFCVIYYYQLFNNIPTLNLLLEPSFWIVTGVFFCMSIQIPITLTIDYLKERIQLNNYYLLYSLISFCYTIMHLFFIKAYLCATHQRKVL